MTKLDLALPIAVVYTMAMFGSIAGGWLSGHFIKKGLPIYKARKRALLLIALLVLPMLGAQELGKINIEFKKDEKVNLMHIAICKLLEPYGYYEFEFFDKEGWPHYKVIKELPALKAGEQSVLMKEAIVNYFLERKLIE